MNQDNFFALHITTYDIHIFRYIGRIANITFVDKVIKTKYNNFLKGVNFRIFSIFKPYPEMRVKIPPATALAAAPAAGAPADPQTSVVVC